MHATAPQFTIVTPALNAERTLQRCIDSVRQQTLGDWEHVIVDDGSTDATVPLARAAAALDPRVRLIAQATSGAAAARNRGVAESRGEWLVFLDADDALEPDYLDVVAKASQALPHFDVYATNGMRTYPDGSQVPSFPSEQGEWREITLRDQIAESHLTVTSAIRRSDFDSLGGFADTYAEDFEFWLRVLASGRRVVRLNQSLVRYDFTSATAKSRTREPELDSVIRSLEALGDSGVDESIKPYIRNAIERYRADRELVAVKARIRSGVYAGARRAFWRNRRAMAGLRRWAIVGLVAVSPRLYRLLAEHQDPSA